MDKVCEIIFGIKCRFIFIYFSSLIVFSFRDNDIKDCDLELFFSSDHEVLGKIIQHDLKPGGPQIAVTDENKTEYLELITQWFFSRGVEQQTASFMEGFNDVIPQQWLQYFDEKELEVIRMKFYVWV